MRMKATASPIVLATSPKVPDTATVVASATRNQALTSSTAAQATVSAPTGFLSIRRSARMRASTGKAVIDIDTPMNSAKETNFVCGARIGYSGNATAKPSTIGRATLELEIAAAWVSRPFS